MKTLKTILFGGSFDPVHKGHLCVGREVFRQLGADCFIFVPANRSPHKEAFPTSGDHRLEMIRLAIAGDPHFSVSDCELNRAAPSYTLDTIHFFRKQLGPDAVLYWLIGADQLNDFDKWFKVTELVDACDVCVMYRAGYPKPSFDRFRPLLSDWQITKLERNVVQTSLIPISSTDIRRQLAQGTLPDDLLDEPVLQYIRSHQLYGITS